MLYKYKGCIVTKYLKYEMLQCFKVVLACFFNSFLRGCIHE